MDSFTDQVYKKSREVLKNQKFEKAWEEFISTKVHASALLAADGPVEAHANGPDLLRKKVEDDKRANADIILEASKNAKSAGKWQERAATFKMLKHFYRSRKRGAQDVWVYSPPHAYTKWIFAELGGDEAAVKKQLADEKEVYNDTDKQRMCDALQHALKSSELVVSKLGEVKGETRDIVERWFADPETTKEQIDAFLPKLLAGFKKISNVCNSTKLIFTSDPSYRKDDDKFRRTRGAVFPGGEGSFPVIYLEGAFMEMGNSGQIWKCAKTIVHEASHHEVKTKDLARDGTGLKPDKDRFPHAKAVNNADSWGYFAIDLNGLLSKADRKAVLKDWK